MGMDRLICMRVKCLCLSLFFYAAICAAQTQPPDTPAGHQCAAWLENFNRGDHDGLRDFLEKNYPTADLDRELAFRKMTGGFDFKKVEETTPTKLVALVQERSSDQFARLTVEIEAADPHRITKIDLNAIPRPADFPLPHLSPGELIAASRKDIEQEVAADRFAGVVLIAKRWKAGLRRGFRLG